jgi:hypothetical protein
MRVYRKSICDKKKFAYAVKYFLLFALTFVLYFQP